MERLVQLTTRSQNARQEQVPLVQIPPARLLVKANALLRQGLGLFKLVALAQQIAEPNQSPSAGKRDSLTASLKDIAVVALGLHHLTLQLSGVPEVAERAD